MATVLEAGSDPFIVTAAGTGEILTYDPTGGPGSTPAWVNTDTLLAGDGALGTPSMSFASEINTGLRRDAAGVVVVDTLGAPAMRIEGTIDAATGNEVAYQLTPTINKATSGNYTALEIDVTETNAPGTDDRVVDLKVDGVTRAYVTNLGRVKAGQTPTNMATDPALSFGGAADMGFWANTAAQMGWSVSGVARLYYSASLLAPAVNDSFDLGSSGLQFKDIYINGIAYLDQVQTEAGSAADPAVRWESAATGMHYAAGLLGLSVSGTEALTVRSLANGVNSAFYGIDQTLEVDLDEAEGAYFARRTLVTETNTDSTAQDWLDYIAVGGTQEFGVTPAGTVLARGGSGAATLAYSFLQDPDTGIVNTGANAFSFVTNAVERVNVGTTWLRPVTANAVALGGAANYWTAVHLADGSAANPSINFQGSNTGFFVAGGLRVAIGGAEYYQFGTGSFSPLATNARDLGATSLNWQNVYAREFNVYDSAGAQAFYLWGGTAGVSTGIVFEEGITGSTFGFAISGAGGAAGEAATGAYYAGGFSGAASGAAAPGGAKVWYDGSYGGNGDATYNAGAGGDTAISGGAAGTAGAGGGALGGDMIVEAGSGTGAFDHGRIRIGTGFDGGKGPGSFAFDPPFEILSGDSTTESTDWLHSGPYNAPRLEVGPNRLASWHSVRTVGTDIDGNRTLASQVENGDSLGNVTLATDDLVLLTAQTTASENGPWVVQATGAPERPGWFTTGDAASGSMFYVEEGYHATRWFECLNVIASDTVDTHNLSFGLISRTHYGESGAPDSADDYTGGYFIGDRWQDATLSPTTRMYTYTGDDGGSPVWRLDSNYGRHVIETGTTLTIDDDNDGDSITCNNASTITVTVNSFTGHCKLIQLGAGQVRVSAGTATKRVHADFDQGSGAAYAKGQYSEVHIEGRGTTIYISGHLAVA